MSSQTKLSACWLRKWTNEKKEDRFFLSSRSTRRFLRCLFAEKPRRGMLSVMINNNRAGSKSACQPYSYTIFSLQQNLYFNLWKPCRYSLRNSNQIWYKVDFPAPFTPAMITYFFTKINSSQQPSSASFEEENHRSFHKMIFPLLFLLPALTEVCLLVAATLYL